MQGTWQLLGIWWRLLLLAAIPLTQVQATHSECSLLLRFQEQQAGCLEAIRSENQSSESPGPSSWKGCLTEWDGISCWPAASPGQSRAVPCPEFLQMFKRSEALIHRNCTESGWSRPSPPYSQACELDGSNKDTEPSSNKDTEAKGAYFATVKVLYTCGYSASLAALLLAISIFCCFRKLHCTRNSIHTHFFASFVLRVAAVFIKDSVFFADASIDHCTMSTVNCKAAMAFVQYAVLANFYWLLVEGMYLQTLLLFTFTSDKRYFWWYTLIGWGVPVLVVSLWVFARLQYDNHGCWDDYASLYWWLIKAPILFAIFTNFLIFLNVIRMLVQKIRSPDAGKSYKQQYMRLAKSTLLLIPLFGVHYLVFALFPEHIGVMPRLYFELVLGSYQGFLVALLYCFLNGEVQAEIQRNWGKWQLSMESNVFNLVTQDSTA
ncbi:vasoactive intestinal polypeptide receptor 1-like [Pelodiscus sinensis]|uniref:vasoactive intestinal polypeptide receptor 1-like n=1 Tax=Pelodiscus sinensis TaxID=13735 RepID=UPI003F6D4D31